ncbi:MAG: glycerol-3-phosphate dehydrogenase [Candidatus Marinimicrobia bacterium]|jgi:glycerol-3-phosphate dehydrogenase|nr:glycerol-3-phosphate dehydrogenase [Candidatus Neomarinimicrobiota bacterium]MBT4361731.1 glycerol-3-phosphate dehydrogenase [Candidatus Neomarinimicrobiota bacterium]MBT4715877.1 glycerol-3-phosphate dehydrogenase [Candidatus Neomarinimicrobiota bacterium]MBT4947782.1 glycerol-3-phosphate dehydrogenase [Candidatus Neomarinimicrobiota bacterium]MBT5271269.1 glycerol-3-phosphate dehydrogenase [Candidatus Neomarinimicrobiota bacterium]
MQDSSKYDQNQKAVEDTPREGNKIIKPNKSRIGHIEDQVFDVAIIGGGINGAGIALDLALRGVKTILLEKKDFGWYATSASTKLIHGGLRYLEYFELSLVRESMAERERLLSNASHLVHPLNLNVPVFKHSKRPAWMVHAGLTLYDILSFDKSLPNHKFMRNSKKNRNKGKIDPAINPDGLSAVLSYYDCQVPFPERLAAELIEGAGEAGAQVLNYSEVVDLDTGTSNRPHLLEVKDVLTGDNFQIQAQKVINAGGPFVDLVNVSLGEAVGRKMGGTKGSHLLIKKFEGGPTDAIYVEARQDFRPYFIIPWRDYYLVGTTDIFYDGDMDNVHAGDDEIKYLLDELNFLIPGKSFSEEDVVYTYSGIRPLFYEPGKKERSVTRKHIILDHQKVTGTTGVYSIIGGKLTTYRSLAEETGDLICKHLNVRAKCSTRSYKLPGARMTTEIRNQIKDLQATHKITDATIAHLIDFYGSRALNVLMNIGKRRDLTHLIHPKRPEIFAEIAYAVEWEHAQSLTDIFFRRTDLGSHEDGSIGSVNPPVIELVSSLLGWTPEQARIQEKTLLDTMARQGYRHQVKVPGQTEKMVLA